VTMDRRLARLGAIPFDALLESVISEERTSKAKVKELLGVLAVLFRASEGEEYVALPRALLPVLGIAIADKKAWTAAAAAKKKRAAAERRAPYLRRARELARDHPDWKAPSIARQICRESPGLKPGTVRKWITAEKIGTTIR
jgi:hypothetical protein